MTGAEGYTGRDYGTHRHQWLELLERWGLLDPDPQAVGWEQDLREDLEAEARGDDRPYGITRMARPVNNTNLRMAA